MSVQFPYRKVLVPMDFSDDSRRAGEHGLAIARACGAPAGLLTVIEEAFPYPELFAWDHPNEEFYKAMRQRALAHMQDVVDAAGEGVSVERIVVRGRPRHEIVAVAADWGADLIVLGSHGHGPLRQALLGSVATGVAADAACAVEIIRAGRQAVRVRP